MKYLLLNISSKLSSHSKSSCKSSSSLSNKSSVSVSSFRLFVFHYFTYMIIILLLMMMSELHNNDFVTSYAEASLLDWRRTGQKINGYKPYQWLGNQVIFNDIGNLVAVSSSNPSNYQSSGNIGMVEVYQYNDINYEWEQYGLPILDPGLSAISGFGQAMAMNGKGNLMVIAAPDSNSGEGFIILYRWSEVRRNYITMTTKLYGANVNDRFGTSVAMSSNSDDSEPSSVVVAVANAGYINNGDYSGWQPGEVTMWTLGGIEPDGLYIWVPLGNHIIDGTSNWQQLPVQVQVSLNGNGTRLAVGAYFKAGRGADQNGNVKVYEKKSTSDNWNQLGDTIMNPNNQNGDGGFGYTVSLNNLGNMIAIGAPFSFPKFSTQELEGCNNYTLSCIAGEAYIFKSFSDSFNTTTNWTQIGDSIYISPYDTVQSKGINDQGPLFAEAISFTTFGDSDSNDSSIAIGCSNCKGNVPATDLYPNIAFSAGMVRVYNFSANTNTYQQVGKSLYGLKEEESFGSSVSLNAAGDSVASGTPWPGNNRIKDGWDIAQRVGHAEMFTLQELDPNAPSSGK